MTQSQIRLTKRAKAALLALELFAYTVTLVVLPLAAFVVYYPYGPRSVALGVFWYWIVPIGFGVFLLMRAFRGLRSHRAARIFVIVLALISILWPISLKVYQAAMAPVFHEQRVREEKARQQEKDELNKRIERNEELRQLAAQRGCGERPGFNSQEYSYRINFYREKIIELRGEYTSFVSTLSDLKSGDWEDCAEGRITVAQLQEKYAGIPDYIVTVYRQNYGDPKFQEFEAVFKEQQALSPDREIY